jgi:hypothetical protein
MGGISSSHGGKYEDDFSIIMDINPLKPSGNYMYHLL